MKILICANVFGKFELLKKDAEFSLVDLILIAGNVGIEYGGEFEQYWRGDLKINQQILFITGKHEDFGFAKDIKEYAKYCPTGLDPDGAKIREISYPIDIISEGVFSASGVSGTYSPIFYEKPSAPPRHMTKKQLFGINKGLDIVLLHNVPGRLSKAGALDFDPDLFNLIESKTPKYIFIGGYDRFSHFFRKDTTVVFLPALTKGYALIDTKDWSCLYQNKMK